jgi:hypothetical protein
MMRESRSASRALSVPVLNDSRSAKSREATANDRLLHFMAQPPKVEKHGDFGVTSQFVIEVQPLFIRNNFQTASLPACPRINRNPFCSNRSGSGTRFPDVIRDRIVQLALDEPDLSHYGLKSDIGPCPKSARTITAPGKVVGRAVAIRMQIEDLCHNTKMSRRP